jgi:hypothetical protein
MDEPATVAPFVVRGRIAGVLIERAAYTTDQAEQLTQRALAEGVEDGCSWLVRSVDEMPGSEPIVLFARGHAELAGGDARRAVHAILVLPGRLLASTLAASCGLRLVRAGVEFVAPGTGMPCERCTALLAVNTTSLPDPSSVTPPRQALPDLHPDLADLLTQLGYPASTPEIAPSHRGLAELLPPARTER